MKFYFLQFQDPSWTLPEFLFVFIFYRHHPKHTHTNSSFFLWFCHLSSTVLPYNDENEDQNNNISLLFYFGNRWNFQNSSYVFIQYIAICLMLKELESISFVPWFCESAAWPLDWTVDCSVWRTLLFWLPFYLWVLCFLHCALPHKFESLFFQLYWDIIDL